jgi:hypothetical protein
MMIDPGGPLTDAELRDFVRLLARYAKHGLDQFDNWQLETTYGPAYVVVTRELPPGGSAEVFAPIWPPRPSAADRPEDAS